MTETERIIEICEECGACVGICNFLDHYCDSPRDLAKRFQRNVLENIEIPYSCSLCGLCRSVCPHELCPGDMCLETREAIFKIGHKSAIPSVFVYDYMIKKQKAVRNHQILSASSVFTLSKVSKKKGKNNSKSVFFPGCSLPAYSSELVISAYRSLREKIPNIGIVLNCCGKASQDVGDRVLFQAIFKKLVKELSSLGIEEVVTACVNCHKTFIENSDIKARTIYEVISEMGLPKSAKKYAAWKKYALKTTPELIPEHSKKKLDYSSITIHDSCPARGRPETRKSVRNIASQMGFKVDEMKLKNEMTQCCGGGGCAQMGNAALADRHAKARAEQANSLIVTYCAHCREILSSYAPTLHILDIVFGTEHKKAIKEYRDSWQNWLNRWFLKKKLQFMNIDFENNI